MGETYRAEIRGQRFDVPVSVDEATTRAAVEKVAAYYAAAESEAEVVNTQVFALRAAVRLALELGEARAAHTDEIARLKSAHEQALAAAQQANRDVEHEMADALKGLGKALRELLNEMGGTPTAPLRFPGGRD